ncbi:MAG: hypothetical protein ACJ796_01160 [Gemmatimonadaceae bacterium]|jgi:hypothetical protein
MDRERELPPVEGQPPATPDEAEGEAHTPEADRTNDDVPNPPRTTTGKWTSPKFGSAGSGGAEFEPGPERD